MCSLLRLNSKQINAHQRYCAKNKGSVMKGFTLTKENAKMLTKRYATPMEVISTLQIENNYRLLHEQIPRLKIFYAIKANPAQCILKKLAILGANFDVASAGEIKKLMKLGITGERMIYANPIKTIEGLKVAKEAGITKFTFDSKAEIDKIKEYIPDAEVLARLKLEKTTAVINLNTKFGAGKEAILDLLNYAKVKGLRASGICFHVGSQMLSTHTYLEAILLVRELIDKAKAEGIDIKYVDIGGGLPAPALNTEVNTKQMMREINEYLEKFLSDVEIWAEPGRYMCANAVNIITSIIGKKMQNDKEWYYIDDGIYGSFSGVLFDHWDYDIIHFNEGNLSNVTLAGPSCDSLDVVKKDMLCPSMEIGDIFVARNAGAYSTVSATTFNGFSIPKTIEWEFEQQKGE